MTLSFVPIIVILIHTKDLLIHLGQSELAAEYAQEYMFNFLPGLFILGHIDIHRRFLQSMGKNRMPMICLCIGVLVHLVLSYIFVIKMEMGIKGTGLAGVFMNLTIIILQFSWAHLMMPDIKETLTFPNK